MGTGNAIDAGGHTSSTVLRDCPFPVADRKIDCTVLFEVCTMRGLHIRLLLLPAIATIGGTLFASAIHAQANPQTTIAPPARIHRPVHIIEQPALESVQNNLAIITSDERQSRGNRGAFWHRALRHRSKAFDRDGEISYQAEPEPYLYGFSRACGRP
jgi:hypothetical protein